MKRTVTSALACVAAGGLAAAMVATPAAAAHENTTYEAELTELNDSGASGAARLMVSDDGETMTIDLSATGLNLDGPHAMHLHGIVDDGEIMASACPTMADDADGDGVLTVAEGAPRYGAVQLSITTNGDTSPESALAVERYPAGTSIDYSRSRIDIPDELKPGLGKLHFVVHGIDENDNGTLDMDQQARSSLTEDLPREATAPALCGTMTVAAMGPIQTGAGGLADEAGAGSATPLAAALGLGTMAVAVAGRRRTRTAPSQA